MTTMTKVMKMTEAMILWMTIKWKLWWSQFLRRWAEEICSWFWQKCELSPKLKPKLYCWHNRHWWRWQLCWSFHVWGAEQKSFAAAQLVSNLSSGSIFLPFLKSGWMLCKKVTCYQHRCHNFNFCHIKSWKTVKVACLYQTKLFKPGLYLHSCEMSRIWRIYSCKNICRLG